jgi:hypothetical protein
MTRNQFICPVMGSFFICIVGWFLDIVYAVEEDGVLNEGLKNGFYDLLKPFWTTIIRPVPYYLFDLLPENEMKYVCWNIIGIAFWLIIGFFVSLTIPFVWSRLRSQAEP